jgi:hypothetical protein
MTRALRSAQMLMRIARDERLTRHAEYLPPSWATIYELARLDDRDFASRGLFRK